MIKGVSVEGGIIPGNAIWGFEGDGEAGSAIFQDSDEMLIGFAFTGQGIESLVIRNPEGDIPSLAISPTVIIE